MKNDKTYKCDVTLFDGSEIKLLADRSEKVEIVGEEMLVVNPDDVALKLIEDVAVRFPRSVDTY